MAQKEYIKHLYEVEEKSLLEIANATGFNYRTVQKYAYQEDWSKETCRISSQRAIRYWSLLFQQLIHGWRLTGRFHASSDIP
jgi:hypothetical protein